MVIEVNIEMAWVVSMNIYIQLRLVELSNE